MNNNERVVDVLQELNQFVNDRIQGYEHAAKLTRKCQRKPLGL
ncbi:hypothetical protein POKO110462_21600 [Pontibacter korlensis]|nr:hypothetical protein [Pontibacter korlensis]